MSRLAQRLPERPRRYFYDSYKNGSAAHHELYLAQPNSTCPAFRPACRSLNTVNTPRIQITNFDTTKQGFVQLDYNHAFRRRDAPAQGGWEFDSRCRLRRVLPRRLRVPVLGQAFRSTATGQTGTGAYGYYYVSDLSTRGAVNANSEPVRAGHVDVGRVSR